MDTRKQILVIEDDKDILEVLKDLLESEGYQVVTAENGQEGLDRLNAARSLPGLILVDLMMPIMDGFQFREQQKQHPKYKHIPVVVMSADGQVEQRKERVGVRVFLKKPLDMDVVLKTISFQYEKNSPQVQV